MTEFVPNGLLIKQLHDSLEKQANNDLRAKDLTMMQVSVLQALQRAEEKRLPMKQLERYFQIAQSTVAGIVSRLERKGLVEARGDAADKRVKLVQITKAGEAFCEEASAQMRKAEARLVDGFSDEERAQFNALLFKALQNIR